MHSLLLLSDVEFWAVTVPSMDERNVIATNALIWIA